MTNPAYRDNALTALQTRLAAVQTISTVARTLERGPDLLHYTMAQLPIIFLVEPEKEVYEDHPSMRSTTSFLVNLHLYYLDWEPLTNGPSRLNGYLNDIIPATQTDITNNSFSYNTTVVEIYPLEGYRECPLFGWVISLRIEYEHSVLVR
jgi:hypothetical protein